MKIVVTKEDIVFAIANFEQQRFNFIERLKKTLPRTLQSIYLDMYKDSIKRIDNMENKIYRVIVGRSSRYEELYELKERFHGFDYSLTNMFYKRAIEIEKQKNDFEQPHEEELFIDYIERCFEKLESFINHEISSTYKTSFIDKDMYYLHSFHLLGKLAAAYLVMYQEIF